MTKKTSKIPKRAKNKNISSNREKITTLKLQEETKQRLEKLREHKRETYDDIIKKILYVLNAVRDDSHKAKYILEFIDEKRKRMFETEKEIKQEKNKENKEIE